MAEWRFFASVVIIVCITNMSGDGYKLFAQQRTGERKVNLDVLDYDENNTILVRYGDKIIDNITTNSGRYDSIEVIVYAFKETFVLKLKQNRYLFSSSYVEKSLSKSGVVYHSFKHSENHCYYIGTVENAKMSTAAVSTCKGINGYFAVGNFSYHIEPDSNFFNGIHAVYRIRENFQFFYECGTEGGSFNNRFRNLEGLQRRKRSLMWPQDGDQQDKVLELYIASDHSQFIDKGRDSMAVFRRAKNIANIASSSYQSLGIYFVLVGMEVWTDIDQFSVRDSDVDASLHSWYSYRMRNINPYHNNDNAILITRVEFYNQVIGKAIIGSICSNQFSGAIIVDKSSSSAAAGSTMAHEIGHNFGLQHDSKSCSCPDRDSNCIMFPTASAMPATNWSSCSVEQFNTGFSQGLDICLYDIPEIIFEASLSTCGNGIIENDEQCDCGRSLKAECNSECCNSTTCQLVGSASCASGKCCDTMHCQVLEAGHPCRHIASGCDLPEYCDGFLSTCPTDTYRQDGTNCSINGDFAYCYSGRCNSRRSQCELIWGQGTDSSNTLCYQRFNVVGQHYGNCGLKWLPNVTYIACQPSDAMCGKLLCNTTSGQQLAYYQNYFLLSSASLNQFTCNSVIFDFGLRIQDPGLVPNGASCGDKKMCVSQKCVDISSLTTKSCGGLCLENEECNNLGDCQSVIGPSRKQLNHEGRPISLIVGLCILFIVIIPLLLVTGIFGYRFRLRLTECLTKAYSKKSTINSSESPLPSVYQALQSRSRATEGNQSSTVDHDYNAQVSMAATGVSNSIQPNRTAPRPPAKPSLPPVKPPLPSAIKYGGTTQRMPYDRNNQANNNVAGQKPVAPIKPSVFVISGGRPTPPPKPSKM